MHYQRSMMLYSIVILYSFANRVISICNNLPIETVTVSSTAVFKKELDQ